MKRVEVELTVNGVDQRLAVEPRHTLADVLRERLRLTGTHLGCEHGVCGACTVLLDGDAVRSCLLFAVQAAGRHVTTIEGISDGRELHPIQRAFWDSHSFQCGFCAPGIVVSTAALLAENPAPTRDDARAALAAHLCRCTGYESIVDGMMLAAERQREGG